MSLHSNCPHCLRTIRLEKDNTFARHVPGHWRKTCKGFKEKAKWAEAKPLLAMARNTRGDCMKCGTPIKEGPKEGCEQCGPENWVRVKGNYQPVVFEEQGE